MGEYRCAGGVTPQRAVLRDVCRNIRGTSVKLVISFKHSTEKFEDMLNALHPLGSAR